MSQNRRKKPTTRTNQRRKGANRPFGGGGPPPGSYNDNTKGGGRDDAPNRARRYNYVIAIIMLVAVVVPVVVGACFYRDTGAAPYDWSRVEAQTASRTGLSYGNARFMRRNSAESAPTASLPAPQTALGENQLYVGETGHFIGNGFLSFWRSKGGAALFGNPVSEEFQQNGRTVQLFERALFEYHPEARNTPAEVQLGFLGRQLAQQRGLSLSPAPQLPASSANQGVTYFTETSHSIGGAFKTFWDKNNGLFLLGFPITEETSDNGKAVQYFERGRIEVVPEGQAQKVITSAAGDLLIEAKGWPRPTRLNLELNIDEAEIWQGRTLSMKVLNNSDWNWLPQKLQGSAGKDALRFIQVGPTYKAFQTYAVTTEPKAYPLNISFEDPAGRQRLINRSIQVEKFDFNLQQLYIPDDKSDLLDTAAEESDNKALAQVYTTFTPRVLWSGKFGWPTTGPITTEFGERRSYNDRPADPNYYHGGLDIAQGEGVPVYAPAAGKVIYTGTLKVRGNAVAVDHGLGVVSFYYHLSAITSKVGQEIKPGDVLGRVGTTGRSNGPHLHWEIRVNGIPTDPRTFQKLDMSN